MAEGEVAEVQRWFEIELLEQRRGARVTGDGLVDNRRRAAELTEGRDLFHVELEVGYEGPAARCARWDRFRLEDSEGYLLPPLQPNDAIDDELSAGEVAMGGVAFGLYRDLHPRTLWFDTGVPYAASYRASGETIQLELALDVDDEEEPVKPGWREEAGRDYDAALADELANTRPRTQTADLIGAVGRSLGLAHRKLRNGYSFRVPLAEARRQLVLLTFAGADEKGRDLIRFVTICAEADAAGANDRELLRINPKMSYGAVGRLAIGGTEFYVVTDTQLAATADVAELVTAVEYLAWRGDELEARMTGGRDDR